MTDEFDIRFLKALDRLVARYEPHSAVRLAELIRDPKRAEALARELESSVTRVPKTKARPKASSHDRIGMGVLKELRKSDMEKHDIVAEIRHMLLAGKILPSMNSLRHFATMHDLSIGKASSRKAAIVPFLKSLSQLSKPALRSIRDDPMLQIKDSQNSLAQWRKIIVRPLPTRTPDKSSAARATVRVNAKSGSG